MLATLKHHIGAGGRQPIAATIESRYQRITQWDRAVLSTDITGFTMIRLHAVNTLEGGQVFR